jgi:crossover junction endodeoxyribonuclease RuvC
MPTERIIMGIDPGTTIMGYGVIRVVGRELRLDALGVIDLKKYANHYLKLKTIHERVSQIIGSFLPDEVAIEAPFFGKNVQSMLKLGRAQGVAIAAALAHDVPICEYAPRKIKQMITGMGEASKEQVALMLQRMFDIKELPKDLDATDGLAAAVCHYYSTTSALAQLKQSEDATAKKSPVPRGAKKSASSWEAFVAKNPEMVASR